MDFDTAFRTVGEFGRYQKWIFVCMSYSQIVTMMQMIETVFVGAVPEFSCYKKGKLVAGNSTCDDQCDVFQFHSKYTSIVTENLMTFFYLIGDQYWTASAEQSICHCIPVGPFPYSFILGAAIESKWNLVCHQAYKVSAVQSIFMAGVLVGALIFGLLSDRFGRKISLFYAIAATAFSSMAGAWCMDLSSFMILRFITGFHNSGVILCTYVLMMELIGNSWRMVIGSSLQIFAAVGIMLYALMAKILTDWRSLVFAMSFILLPLLLLYTFIPESPRWLYSRGRVHDAELVMERIAQKNRISTRQIILVEQKENAVKSGSTLDLVRNSILCRYTVILFYAWFVSSCVYYGLTISAGSLGSDMYASVALSGLVEIPANTLVILLLYVWGRRTVICGSMIVSGCSCLLIMWFSDGSSTVITTLATMGKFMISAAFNIVYIWSAEIFPTFLRNGAMGLMSVGARCGGIMSPIIILLGKWSFPAPYFVYGTLALTAGLFSYSLPETKGQSLPETTDDVLRLGGHFVDNDHDKTWSTELLLEERNIGIKSQKKKPTRSHYSAKVS